MVGSKIVSPSIITITSWLAAAMPVLSAAGLPALTWRITRTQARRSLATVSAVPSLDPSSTTITSTGWSLATNDLTVAVMVAFSL